MPSTGHREPGADDDATDVSRVLSSVNSVLSLSLILAQASSPAQVMRLVTTAVPSIAASHSAVAWHPGKPGDYYERAPEDVGRLLAGLTGVARLGMAGSSARWAFPVTSPLEREQVFLVVTGDEDLSDQETFLLSVLAQLCGTVIAGQERAAAERERGKADRERDVAEARAAMLAASEARQRAILETALDAVITIDRHARVTYVNSAFERTFGYRAAEVIGRDLAETIVPPSLREAHRRGLTRYLETGQSTILDRRLDMRAMRRDGTEFPAEVAITRTGLPGEPGFTAYVRDITERQRAERDLMASRARLVSVYDTARQRITRDLHDGAQQRLVATLISLQLAEQRWESAPSRARELLGLALEDAKRGIKDLRDLAAGLHPAALTQHGLAAAVRDLAARVPVPVEVDMPDIRLPPAVEASLYFFCSEALTNIVKHAQATCAWIRLEVGPEQCVIEVRDDGIGGARPGSEASGLIGLADRISALSGTLDITSPPSHGTVLRAAVPLPPRTAPLPGLRPLPRLHPADGAWGTAAYFHKVSSPQRIRVIVGEDQPFVREGIVRVLDDGDFEVLGTATDATDLVRLADVYRPDVVVADIQMPPDNSDDGLRAALAIRAAQPGVGVLVLSQFLEDTYAFALVADGAQGTGYLLKEKVGDLRTFTDAVRRVADGGSVLDPDVVARLVGRKRTAGPLDRLTPRERQVLTLIAEGRSNAGIAQELVVTVAAIERHVTSIFEKLGLHASPEAHRRVLAVLKYLRA